MKFHHISLLALLGFLLCSCDPYYFVEYKVENNSERTVQIVLEDPFTNELDTNIISDGTILTIHIQDGIGQITSVMDNIESIDFELLEIEDKAGNPFQRDPLEFQNWRKEYPERNSEMGAMRLTLFPVDF